MLQTVARGSSSLLRLDVTGPVTAASYGWLGEQFLGVLYRRNMWRPCPSVCDQVSAKLLVAVELFLDGNLFGKREFLECRLSDSRTLLEGLK